jgi:uncharacterized membrane protein
MNAMAVFLFSFVLIGALPLFVRAKGASVFMMLCVGKALVATSATEISFAARQVLNSSLPVDEIARVFLMFLPAVLTLIVTKKAGKKKLVYHVVPAIVGGLLAGFWAVAELGHTDGFELSTTYGYVQANISLILAVGVLASLLLFFVERPKPVKPDEHSGHGK